jgi:NADPH:quinone reductase-like Zn-dependent oxidoreductase
LRAIVATTCGSADVLELEEIEKPNLTDDGVPVRVRATSVNRGDWYAPTGTPYVARNRLGLRKPKSQVFGVDFAGTVEAVGSTVRAA